MSIARGGVGATVAGGGAILDAIGVSISNEGLLFLKEDDEDFGVDMIGLGGLVDDASGGLAIEGFVGHTDVVAIFNVPTIGRGLGDVTNIVIGFGKVGIITGVF